MQVFVKQCTGRSITLELDPTCVVSDLVYVAFEKRDPVACTATLENWAKSITFMFAGKPLDLPKSLAESGLSEFATVHEVLKSWTMTHGFDTKTLAVVDAVTTNVIAAPWIVYPCFHAFEKSTMIAWALHCRKNEKPLTCPMCRGLVNAELEATLFD